MGQSVEGAGVFWRTVFKGETDQDEQRERLRPGDGRKKGGCQRQTKGDVLGERESAGTLL